MAQSINLKHFHPHSILYLFYLMSPWIGFGILFTLVLALLTMVVVDLPVPANTELFAQFSAVTIALFICLGIARFLYGLAYMRSYNYVVQHGNLIVSKGVLLKKQGSYPLRRITDVYIRNDWRTFLFGLYTVEVLTPSRESHEFCRIDGLTHRSALSLKERLLKLIERSEQEQKVQIDDTPSTPTKAYARHSLVARRHPRTEFLLAN